MAINAAVIVDTVTGQPLMVVVPDYDEQLKDPSFNLPGTRQILVPMDTYKISTSDQLSSIISAATTNPETNEII